MTDKLKCPFCGEELAPHIDEWKSIRKLFICNNTGCFCWGQPMLLEIWQALIDGKRAQDAIQKIKDIVYPALDREFYSELRDDMLDIGRIIVSVEKQE